MVVKFALGVLFCTGSSCSIRETSVTRGHPGICLMKNLKELLRKSNLILRKKGENTQCI